MVRVLNNIHFVSQPFNRETFLYKYSISYNCIYCIIFSLIVKFSFSLHFL